MCFLARVLGQGLCGQRPGSGGCPLGGPGPAHCPAALGLLQLPPSTLDWSTSPGRKAWGGRAGPAKLQEGPSVSAWEAVHLTPQRLLCLGLVQMSGDMKPAYSQAPSQPSGRPPSRRGQRGDFPRVAAGLCAPDWGT